MSGQPHSLWGGEHAITNHAFVEDGMKKGRSLGRLIHGKNYECTHTPIPLPTHPHSQSFILFSSNLPPHPLNHPSIPPPVSSPTNLSFLYSPISPSFHPLISPSFFFHPPTHSTIQDFIHPSFFLSIYSGSSLPSIHLPVYPYTCLSSYPSVHPSFHRHGPDCM